jgi:hypothetical protein
MRRLPPHRTTRRGPRSEWRIHFVRPPPVQPHETKKRAAGLPDRKRRVRAKLQNGRSWLPAHIRYTRLEWQSSAQVGATRWSHSDRCCCARQCSKTEEGEQTGRTRGPRWANQVARRMRDKERSQVVLCRDRVCPGNLKGPLGQRGQGAPGPVFQATIVTRVRKRMTRVEAVGSAASIAILPFCFQQPDKKPNERGSKRGLHSRSSTRFKKTGGEQTRRCPAWPVCHPYALHSPVRHEVAVGR